MRPIRAFYDLRYKVLWNGDGGPGDLRGRGSDRNSKVTICNNFFRAFNETNPSFFRHPVTKFLGRGVESLGALEGGGWIEIPRLKYAIIFQSLSNEATPTTSRYKVPWKGGGGPGSLRGRGSDRNSRVTIFKIFQDL